VYGAIDERRRIAAASVIGTWIDYGQVPRRRHGSQIHEGALSRGNSATDVQAAKEPNNEKNDYYQAQRAAKPRPTISIVPVISAAAAEHQDD
jgi:hypothetical protein